METINVIINYKNVYKRKLLPSFVMRRIHETFTEEEFNFIEKIKNKHKQNWHDFILELCRKDVEVKGGKRNEDKN